MAQPWHHPKAGTGYGRGQSLSHGRRARPVIFTCQDVERRLRRVNVFGLVGKVVLNRVVVQIAFEDGRRIEAIKAYIMEQFMGKVA
jgi:hypothetical protein